MEARHKKRHRNGEDHPRPAEEALETTPDPRIKQGFHKKSKRLRGSSDGRM